MEELKLSLKREQVKVSLELEDGTTEEFTMRQISGAEKDSYLTLLADRMKMDAAGNPSGIRSVEGLQAELVSRCLLDKNGQAVEAKRIQSWRSLVVEALFEKAQTMNGMNQAGRAALKNP